MGKAKIDANPDFLLSEEFAHNYPGSSRWKKPACGCPSWIAYWKANTDEPLPDICPCCKAKCPESDFEGGHIKVDGISGTFITPICKSCNLPSNKKEFDVDEKKLVPGNTANCKANHR